MIMPAPRIKLKSRVIKLLGGQLTKGEEQVVGPTPLPVKLVAKVGNKADLQWVKLHLLTSVPLGLALAQLSKLVVTGKIPQVDHLAWGSLSRICLRGVFSCRQSSPCWKPGWRV